ncbi:hypothetical protein [Alteromonas sp. CYL-A6]|uniref:hypothetical protein n=1 Tax=Alteromonas nitratireducens TaxID=3390813 RepID=UPI0034BADC5B
MEPREFILHCRNELRTCFENTKRGDSDDVRKNRTEGLFQACRLLGILTSDEVRDIYEEEHIHVFGETIQRRKERKEYMAKLKASSPDDYFDIPAIERRQ